MKNFGDEFVSEADRLAARLEELERRVAALERSSVAQAPAPVTAAAPTIPQDHPLAQLSRSGNVMPVFGKVFLGMAGAYGLRALAEAGSLHLWAVAGVAMLYAGMWLLWAARTPAEQVLASAAYATTAAAILLPMLWELTLRFKVLPPTVTATLLAGFVAAAFALGWKKSASSVVWVPAALGAVAGGVLLVGTRDPFPFAVALLLMAIMAEAAACSDRWIGLRPLVAVPVDVVMVAVFVIYTSADGVPHEYKLLTAGKLLGLFAGLFVIYAASVLFRTVTLRRKISAFEAVQATAAFVLAALAALRTTHDVAAIGVGSFCLLAAAAFYWLAAAKFGVADLQRNYHVFSSWAIALALTGSSLCFPANANTVWLGVAAVAATVAGVRAGRFSLAFHGAIYLAAMALVSGLMQYLVALLIGQPTLPGEWPVWVACCFTVTGYALAWKALPAPGPQRPQRILHLSFAALAACSTLALAMTAGLMAVSLFNTGANAARVAAVRTLVICLLALLLGASGARWKRTELIWLAYASIALCTAKLLFEDLRVGSAGTIAFSLFCYGLVWVLVPRFARASKATAPEQA